MAALRARHPRFREAVMADARVTAQFRGERPSSAPPLDRRPSASGWPGRATPSSPRRSTGPRRGCRRWACRSCRGWPTGWPWRWPRCRSATRWCGAGRVHRARPGGCRRAGGDRSGVALFPWVTIGLRAGDVRGATIERDVSIGTGAKVIGARANRRRGHGRRERRRAGRRARRRHRRRCSRATGRIGAAAAD